MPAWPSVALAAFMRPSCSEFFILNLKPAPLNDHNPPTSLTHEKYKQRSGKETGDAMLLLL
jgi:hypothetical protein